MDYPYASGHREMLCKSNKQIPVKEAFDKTKLPAYVNSGLSEHFIKQAHLDRKRTVAQPYLSSKIANRLEEMEQV
jgi:hypothetical protein